MKTKLCNSITKTVYLVSCIGLLSLIGLSSVNFTRSPSEFENNINQKHETRDAYFWRVPKEPSSNTNPADPADWDPDQKYILELPVGTTSISEGAYKNLRNIQKIVIPNTVKSIGSHAFYNCRDLTEVVIPSSVEEIGQNAFEGHNQLKADGLKSYSPVLFSWWVKNHEYQGKTIQEMNEVNLADFKNSAGMPFTRIADGAFNSKALSKLTIPANVISVHRDAIVDCVNLKPEDLINHSSVLFNWWVNHHPYEQGTLMAIIEQDGKLNLNDYKNSSGQSFTIIDDRAFMSCQKLTELVLGDEVSFIGHMAFSDNQNLKAINFPQTLVEIGEAAFALCAKIETVQIPDRVSKIGDAAFSDCYELKCIRFPKKLTVLNQEMVAACFKLTDVVLPEELVKINDGAFYCCMSLRELSLPNSVDQIEQYAFGDCSSLTKINLPEKLLKIGSSAFRGCFKLAEIKLPPNLLELGDEVFADCQSLKEIVIPESTRILGNGLFAYTNQLTKIHILAKRLKYNGKKLIENIDKANIYTEFGKQVSWRTVSQNITRDFYVAYPRLRNDLITWGIKKENVHFVGKEELSKEKRERVLLIFDEQTKNGKANRKWHLLANVNKLTTSLINDYKDTLREIVFPLIDAPIDHIDFDAIPSDVKFKVYKKKTMEKMLQRGVKPEQISFIGAPSES